MTIAMSLLVHGEAVRFNRGQSRSDDFDFKYMKGRDGIFPYVSSQCYKRYWRESLPSPFSPIIKEKKNQAFTLGRPIEYVDDDLFGYMKAGATEGGDETASESGGETRRSFEPENIKDLDALVNRLLEETPLSRFILDKTPELRETLQAKDADNSNVEELILNALDEAARSEALGDAGRTNGQSTRKRQRALASEKLQEQNKKLLLRAFKELQDNPKRKTTRRTAPVRMHALVAFSGIKTARDFQTFSRNIAYTGENSVLNPSHPGIYSGWLKTRILIESHRIGKFYVGENMDVLKDEVIGREVLKEANPYSRNGESVEYVQLDNTERTNRLRAVLRALADIGNKQGPASGALHDGSLRPKAFVAGMMNCADSPFDYVWIPRNDDSLPHLDLNLLRSSIQDWDDIQGRDGLFAAKKIYIGLPEPLLSELKSAIEDELKKINFEAIIDTPRRALRRLTEDATL